MAFALTKAEFRGIVHQGPSYKRGIQEVLLTITGANTDIDLDIGDNAGTFWTAAQADATYGTMAGLVLDQLEAVVAVSEFCAGFKCPELQQTAFVQVASAPGASQYSLTSGTYGPNILLNSGTAPTSYKVLLQYELDPAAFPVTASYNI